MKITLRGKNIEITEAIEEKVSEKLSKLDKYFIVSENVEAKVLVRTYPYGQKIEVTIPTEYVLLRAEVVDQDLYNAIDLVIDIFSLHSPFPLRTIQLLISSTSNFVYSSILLDSLF